MQSYALFLSITIVILGCTRLPVWRADWVHRWVYRSALADAASFHWDNYNNDVFHPAARSWWRQVYIYIILYICAVYECCRIVIPLHYTIYCNSFNSAFSVPSLMASWVTLTRSTSWCWTAKSRVQGLCLFLELTVLCAFIGSLPSLQPVDRNPSPSNPRIMAIRMEDRAFLGQGASLVFMSWSAVMWLSFRPENCLVSSFRRTVVIRLL